MMTARISAGRVGLAWIMACIVGTTIPMTSRQSPKESLCYYRDYVGLLLLRAVDRFSYLFLSRPHVTVIVTEIPMMIDDFSNRIPGHGPRRPATKRIQRIVVLADSNVRRRINNEALDVVQQVTVRLISTLGRGHVNPAVMSINDSRLLIPIPYLRPHQDLLSTGPLFFTPFLHLHDSPPPSGTMAEKVDALRAWTKNRSVPAD